MFTPLAPSCQGRLNSRHRGCKCGIRLGGRLRCHNLARRLPPGRKRRHARLPKQHSAAALSLFGELALPVNKDAFEAGVIWFSDKAELIHPFMKVTSLVTHARALNADDVDGYTNITSALELSSRIIKEALGKSAPAGVRYVRPLVVLMSDGAHNEGPSPLPAADSLKQMADILTVAFGADADDQMLTALATEQLNVRCRTGAELRCYFAEIGRTLTITRAAGVNFTASLVSKPE